MLLHSQYEVVCQFGSRPYSCCLEHFGEAWIVVDAAIEDGDARLEELHAGSEGRDAASEGILRAVVHLGDVAALSITCKSTKWKADATRSEVEA